MNFIQEKSETQCDLYLTGSQVADYIVKGLYAGLKQRDGLPTHLPLVLQNNDEYVNAGFIDSLPCTIIRDLNVSNVSLHLVHQGNLKISIYVLIGSGEVFHSSDHIVSGNHRSRIELASTCFQDPNARLIYFRIQTISEDATLCDWFYTIPVPEWAEDIKPLQIISRSLGDSPSLIGRFSKHCKRLSELKLSYPELKYLPTPHLKIYESDSLSYKKSKDLISTLLKKHVTLVANPYNLGGGGNMCLAVNEEIISKKSTSQFAMLDSDTVLPFRTFYWSSLVASNMARLGVSRVRVPIVLYSSQPNKVLESGGLFGRGNWGIVSSTPTQPCIQPLHHRGLISNPKLQAELAEIGYTDYPPFIFSLFFAEKHQLASHFIPIPFFLRGDDIEMGLHLRSANIPCEVDGVLLVFQEPKHSLWHEWMAILHGTCLVLAAAASEERIDTGFYDLQKYFNIRAAAHSRIHDITGLKTYELVLDRLLELLQWPEQELVARFHDPAVYLTNRDLNTSFNVANYRTVEEITRKGELTKTEFIRVPFLYFEPDLVGALGEDTQLPQKIGLVNKTQQTASIIDPYSVESSTVKLIQNRIEDKSRELFDKNSKELARRCLCLTDRAQIIKQYLSKYPIKF